MGKVADRIRRKVGPDKAKKPPRKSRRVPGLLHGLRGVAVEDTNARMRKVCGSCGEVPEGRRLTVREGTGRHGTIEVFCVECGNDWLAAREVEYARAQDFLTNGEITQRRTSLEVEGIRD